MNTGTKRWVLLLLACSVVACADVSGRDEDPFSVTAGQSSMSGGTGIDSSGETDGGASSDTDADGTSGGSSDGTPKLDVGAGSSASDTAGDATGEGCEKVDFLFVIDNSGSMGDNQDSLIASFPGFISSIQNTLDEAQDYHIMVVDTDAQWGGECEALCDAFFGTCPQIPEYPCGQGPPTACDQTLGAGVTYTMGSDAPSMPCDFSTGKRFMDTTEPDLDTAFQCAAKVGSDGDGNERPMSAMVSALSYDLGQAGACNEGFVRDDAILVVTVITDEEDSDSSGTPDGWYQNIIASKAGDETAIVMLGLINDTDAAAPVCPADSQDPAKIREFVDRFPNSIRASVCEPSYNDFFQQAVDLIDTTCDEFVPPQG